MHLKNRILTRKPPAKCDLCPSLIKRSKKLGAGYVLEVNARGYGEFCFALLEAILPTCKLQKLQERNCVRRGVYCHYELQWCGTATTWSQPVVR